MSVPLSCDFDTVVCDFDAVVSLSTKECMAVLPATSAAVQLHRYYQYTSDEQSSQSQVATIAASGRFLLGWGVQCACDGDGTRLCREDASSAHY